MSEPVNHGQGELAARFRRALHAETEPGPARLEFERRRLLGRLAAEAAGKRFPAALLAAGLGLATALAAAVIAVVVVRTGDPPPAAESIELSGPWRVRPGDAVSRGAAVRVPRGAGARLELADGSVLWLGPGAELVFLDGRTGAVRLDAGRLLAGVKPRPPGSELRVVAGRLEVVVRGTVFSASAEDGRSLVRLHDGRVDLCDGRGSFDLRPGFEVELSRDGAVSLRPIDEAGALGDLLIAGRTAGTNGPPVPRIPLPPVIDDDPPAPAAIEPPSPAPAPLRRTPPPRAAAPAAEPLPPAVPDETDDAGPAPSGKAAEAAAAPDDLYLRALDQARAGDLDGSRRALLDYLARFPEGRYWDRVRDILGE